MAYTRTNWVDHYTDGGGNVIQQGTPVNAANLNKIESALVALDAATFDRKLPAATDFDAIDENGVYYVNLDAMTAHKPKAAGYGLLEKLGGTGTNAKLQRFTCLNGASGPFDEVYTRTYINQTWGPWMTENGLYRSSVVTGTTDANGNISLEIPASGNRVICVSGGGLIAMPWVSGSSGNWQARVTGVEGSPAASASVTLAVSWLSVG